MDHRPTKPTSLDATWRQTWRKSLRQKSHLCAGAQLQNREEIRQIVTQHITCSRQDPWSEKQHPWWKKTSAQIIHSQAKKIYNRIKYRT